MAEETLNLRECIKALSLASGQKSVKPLVGRESQMSVRLCRKLEGRSFPLAGHHPPQRVFLCFVTGMSLV